MAKVLENIFTSGSDEIAQGFTVESWHVSQSVEAFTGASDYDITISGSLTVIGPTSGSFTGSLLGTSSNAVSSSFSSTASFVRNAQTASYVLNAVSSSFASTASFVNTLNQSVILTGSLNTTGSVTLRGLDTTPKSFVVTIDNTTGQLFYTSSTGFVAGAVSPGAPTGSIQYNNAGTFAGVPTLTFDGTTLRATGSFSGSFTGVYNNLVSLNNTTNATFPMLYASGSGNSITLSGSTGVVLTPSTGRITSNRLQVDGTGTTATGSGVGQIWLNGFGSNLIEYNANGIAAPTTGTRSVGTKIVLWPQISDPGNTDYAIGISSLSLWHSVPSSSYAGTPTAFRWYAGTTNITTLTGTGTFSTNGNVIAFASDKRLKTNIKPIENPLDKVKSLNGFTYNWNDKAKALANYNTEESLVGVFAQEIQEVLPEAVKLAPFDNDMTGNSISGENYLTVQYDKIVPLLIEAIKDQQKQIDELKSKIK
jgi:hypothetical protein